MSSPYPSRYFRYKSIRDPLYGFIDLSETEVKLIDTEAFRRLQSIKQLSHAYVVYPSAIHTRFEHSLGALHLANRLSDELGFDDKTKEIVRLGMLLHDIGHGPFSHLFEQVMEKINGRKNIHEEISRFIIKFDSEISGILGNKVNQVLQLLVHKPIDGVESSLSSLASDVVSSGLDADKLDYLRRDSYHIGVAYGQFDLERIIHMIRHTSSGEKHICIDEKGKDAIENYRLGRYLMHAQVYKHHSRLIADQMFIRALELAIFEEGIINQEQLKFQADTRNDAFLNFFKSLDDRSIYELIINKKPDSKAAKILNDLKKRRLLKRVYYTLPDKEIADATIRKDIMKLKQEDLDNISKEIATDAGLEPHEVIAHISTIPINLYDGEILVLWKGIPRTLDELSPIKASESTIIKFYVFGPSDPNVQTKIKHSITNRLKIPII